MQINARVLNGKLEIGEYNRAKLNDFVRNKDNQGTIVEIKSRTPESSKMRGFFEGAVIPMIVYFQEGLDHRNSEDNKHVREWMKQELNGVGINIKGKIHIVGETTKGNLREFMERVIDWMASQGYPIELLNPEEYKDWRDRIYPFDTNGPETYIDYLEKCGRIKKC